MQCLEDDQVEEIADKMVPEDRHTQFLLYANKIGGRGGGALARAVAGHRTIQILDLTSNSLGDDGVGAFGAALRANRTLVYLSLSGNSCGDAGVAALCDGLAENPVLEVLHLACNPLITDAGAKSLARVLGPESASVLRVLVLRKTSVGDAGALALGDAFGHRASCLRHLCLKDCRVGGLGAAGLARAVVAHGLIEVMDISRTHNSESELIPSSWASKKVSLDHPGFTQFAKVMIDNNLKLLSLNARMDKLDILDDVIEAVDSPHARRVVLFCISRSADGVGTSMTHGAITAAVASALWKDPLPLRVLLGGRDFIHSELHKPCSDPLRVISKDPENEAACALFSKIIQARVPRPLLNKLKSAFDLHKASTAILP